MAKKKGKKGFKKSIKDAGQEFTEEVVKGMSGPRWKPKR